MSFCDSATQHQPSAACVAKQHARVITLSSTILARACADKLPGGCFSVLSEERLAIARSASGALMIGYSHLLSKWYKGGNRAIARINECNPTCTRTSVGTP
jgi:hypothetical protein